MKASILGNEREIQSVSQIFARANQVYFHYTKEVMFWEKLGFSKRRVYADAAAATPLSKRARRELVRLLPLYGNPGALHREALDAKEELERARASIADTIDAHKDELVFTASGTEANNLALQGVLRPLLLEHGEVHAITSAIEHQSVLMPLRSLEREGLYLTVLPVNSEGLVDPKNLADAINEQTVLVSVQLVNSEIGTIEPIRELVKVVRKARQQRSTRSLHGGNPSVVDKSSTELPLYFHTDASQAPLWVSLAVEQLGVDLMSLDGQKVLGPKGVGCLYIKRGVAVEPILWGGSQEGGLRGGTQNAPLAGSFAIAFRDAQRGVQERAERVAEIRGYLWEEILRLIPGAVVNGPHWRDEASPVRAANNLNISISGLSGELAVVSLDAAGIAASTRSACNAGDEEPSHVITALGLSDELAKTAVRLTLLPDATHADARRIAQTLRTIVQRQQNMV